MHEKAESDSYLYIAIQPLQLHDCIHNYFFWFWGCLLVASHTRAHTCAVGKAHSFPGGSGGMFLGPRLENIGILDLLRVILRPSKARSGRKSLAIKILRPLVPDS